MNTNSVNTKSFFRRLAALLLIGIMTVSLVSCSSPDYIGKWTLSTMNDIPIAEYANQFELASDYFKIDLDVTEEQVTVTSSQKSSTLKIETKSNGFETIQNGEVAFSVLYDATKDTLSYTVDMGAETGKISYCYVRVAK